MKFTKSFDILLILIKTKLKTEIKHRVIIIT